MDGGRVDRAGAFAGSLIEQCGLRGYSVGGAQISEKHCGFVVNRGGATCADVIALTEEVRRIVEEKTGFVRRSLEARKAATHILSAAKELASYPDEKVSALAGSIIDAIQGLEE